MEDGDALAGGGDDSGGDIIISGPDDGSEVDDGGGKVKFTLSPVCVYRVDFEDCTSRMYAAKDDKEAVCLAEFSRPGIARLQVSRIYKDVWVRRRV